MNLNKTNPISLEFKKVRKISKISKIIIGVFSLLLFLQCSKKTNTENDSVVVIGKTYTFFDGVSDGPLKCYEGGDGWELEIIDESTIEIYSYGINPKTFERTNVKSCLTQFKYKFDSETGVFEIMKGTNVNVSQQCLDKFVGKWICKKGQFFEKRFFSEKMNGVDFS